MTPNFDYFVQRGLILNEMARPASLFGKGTPVNDAYGKALMLASLSGKPLSSRRRIIHNYASDLIIPRLDAKERVEYDFYNKKGSVDSIWDGLVKKLISEGRLDPQEFISYMTNEFKFITYMMGNGIIPMDLDNLKLLLSNKPFITDKNLLPKLEEYMTSGGSSVSSEPDEDALTPEEKAEFEKENGPSVRDIKSADIDKLREKESSTPIVKTSSSNRLAGEDRAFREATHMTMMQFNQLTARIKPLISKINQLMGGRKISSTKTGENPERSKYFQQSQATSEPQSVESVANPYSGFIDSIFDAIEMVDSSRSAWIHDLKTKRATMEDIVDSNGEEDEAMMNLVTMKDTQFDSLVKNLTDYYTTEQASNSQISPDSFHETMKDLIKSSLANSKPKRASFFQALIDEMRELLKTGDASEYFITEKQPFINVDPQVIKQVLGDPSTQEYQLFKRWYDANAAWKTRNSEKRQMKIENMISDLHMQGKQAELGVKPEEKVESNPYAKKLSRLLFKVEEAIREMESEDDPDYKQELYDKIKMMNARAEYLSELNDKWESQHGSSDDEPMGESVMYYMTEQVKTDKQFSPKINTEKTIGYKSFKNYNQWLNYNE